MSNTTPARQQYLDFKRQYPDAIVMFRLGDFYEMFDDDAQIAARELDLVLTSRPIAKGDRIPMAVCRITPSRVTSPGWWKKVITSRW